MFNELPFVLVSLYVTTGATSQLSVAVNIAAAGTALHSTVTLARTWTATDACNNISSRAQVITVRDLTAPVLSSPPAGITVECNAVPTAAILTATDNCDASPVVAYNETRTNGSCPNSYTLTRTWTAMDVSGNTTSATQLITVVDTKAPVLSVAPGDITVSCDAIPDPATLTAVDNCDGAPVVTFATTSTYSAYPASVAHYNFIVTRTWTATDACGNSSSKTQIVTVHDVTAPLITCPASVTLNCQDNNASSATGVATATDNCAGAANIVIT